MSETTNNKFDQNILIMQLEERYKAMHVIRERTQNISLWTLGLFSTAAGLLVQNGSSLNEFRKIVLSFLVILIYLLLRFYVLKDLNAGFISQQKVAAKIEDFLKLYDKDYYGKGSILPISWKEAGNKASNGNFFNTYFVMIGMAVIILLLGILFKGKI